MPKAEYKAIVPLLLDQCYARLIRRTIIVLIQSNHFRLVVDLLQICRSCYQYEF